MPDFNYKATEADGGLSSGVITSNTRSEAYRTLRSRGLHPISVTESGGKAVGDQALQDSSELVKLSTPQLLFFTEELAELLEAGLKLESALKVIEQRQEKSGIQPIAARLRQRVRDGFKFSAALQECGKTFDSLYCNLVLDGRISTKSIDGYRLNKKNKHKLR